MDFRTCNTLASLVAASNLSDAEKMSMTQQIWSGGLSTPDSVPTFTPAPVPEVFYLNTTAAERAECRTAHEVLWLLAQKNETIRHCDIVKVPKGGARVFWPNLRHTVCTTGQYLITMARATSDCPAHPLNERGCWEWIDGPCTGYRSRVFKG